MLLDSIGRPPNRLSGILRGTFRRQTLPAGRGKMIKSSFIVIEQPDSFGSFEPFAEVLRQIKKLGFDGAELHLAGPSGYEIDALCRLSETIDLPIVSFLTGCNYFREGLCLS